MCGKQNYTCRKQNEVNKFVHVVCDLRNMAICRRNLQLKLLKAMAEEHDVLNELYGVIVMRKIQLSKRKLRFWIHNIIKKRKRSGVNTWSILGFLIKWSWFGALWVH